jgi:hypothetical protein
MTFEQVNRLEEYVEKDRAGVARHTHAPGIGIGLVPVDQQNCAGEWQDCDSAETGRLLTLDSRQDKISDDYPLPMSPSLISFIASEASCLPHDLEEAKRAGLVYTSSHDDPSDFFLRNENG